MENHNVTFPYYYFVVVACPRVGCAFFVESPLFDNTANIVPYMVFHGNIFKNYSGIYGTVFVGKRI